MFFPFSIFTSQMAELLFYMEKLRGLMKKYNQVVQRYHVQYLAQFDALVLNDTIQVAVHGNKSVFVNSRARVCVCVPKLELQNVLEEENNSKASVARSR